MRSSQLCCKGGEKETQITHFDKAGIVPYEWSRDGKWIVGTRGMLVETKSDIFAVPMKQGKSDAPVAVVQTPDYDKNPALSPNGRWLAYQTENQIFLRPFPGAPGDIPTLVGPGDGPLWDSSGGNLYYRRGTSMVETSAHFDPAARFGAAEVLFRTEAASRDLWQRNMFLSPNNRRFLMVMEAGPRPAHQCGDELVFGSAGDVPALSSRYSGAGSQTSIRVPAPGLVVSQSLPA